MLNIRLWTNTNITIGLSFPDTGLANNYPQKAVAVPDTPAIPPENVHKNPLELMDPEPAPEQIPVFINVPAAQLANALHPPTKAEQFDVSAELIVEAPLKVSPDPCARFQTLDWQN